MKDLDLDYVREMYNYDRDTGRVTYRKSAGCRRAGDSVGWVDKGYLKTKVNHQKVTIHRLVWFLSNGYMPYVIDHINGDTLDNRLCNLRDVDHRGNARNTKVNKESKTGIMGVSWYHGHKWVAYIGKSPRTHLGYSKDFFEACCLRKSAEVKMQYHPNHGSR